MITNQTLHTVNNQIQDSPVTKIQTKNAITNQFIFYPNPACDFITIEGYENSLIEIINLQGQVEKQLKTSGSKNIIDLTKLSNGVYTLKIKNNNEMIVKKLVKQ